MKVAFDAIAWTDLTWWMGQPEPQSRKVLKLIEEIRRTPRNGTGHPERLKHFDTELWSRRVNLVHRIVYEIDGDKITFLQLRGHYWFDR